MVDCLRGEGSRVVVDNLQCMVVRVDACYAGGVPACQGDQCTAMVSLVKGVTH